MLSYEEIIKTLRYCSEHQNDCDGCPLKDVDIPPFLQLNVAYMQCLWQPMPWKYL